MRTVSTTSSEPSDDTMKRLAQMEELEESEGTAKLKGSDSAPRTVTPASPESTAPTDWRSSISQNRFSTIFEGWIRPTSPENGNGTVRSQKKSVSEPKLVAHRTGNSLSRNVTAEQDTGSDVDPVDSDEFEQFLVRLRIAFFVELRWFC